MLLFHWQCFLFSAFQSISFSPSLNRQLWFAAWLWWLAWISLAIKQGRYYVISVQFNHSLHCSSCGKLCDTFVRMALFSSPTACFSSGVSDGTHSCSLYSPALMSPLQPTQCTKISDSSRSITVDAGLMCDGTRGHSSEQHGQFTLPDAAIHSMRHLVHTSVLHINSSGCDRMLALLLLQYGRVIHACQRWRRLMYRRTGGGASKLGVMPAWRPLPTVDLLLCPLAQALKCSHTCAPCHVFT